MAKMKSKLGFSLGGRHVAVGARCQMIVSVLNCNQLRHTSTRVVFSLVRITMYNNAQLSWLCQLCSEYNFKELHKTCFTYLSFHIHLVYKFDVYQR